MGMALGLVAHLDTMDGDGGTSNSGSHSGTYGNQKNKSPPKRATGDRKQETDRRIREAKDYFYGNR